MPKRTAVAIAAGLFSLACADQITEPVMPGEPLQAKPCASPPCGGGGDEPGASSTASLSGDHSTAAYGPQNVSISENGKVLKITAESEHPVSLDLSLPAIIAADFENGTCVAETGFSDPESAASFWNASGNKGGSGRAYAAQVNKKSIGRAAQDHWTQVVWAYVGDIADGNLMKARFGNHATFGPATYSSTSADLYTLTGGGATLSVLGGSGNHTIAAVSCSFAGIGGSLSVELHR